MGEVLRVGHGLSPRERGNPPSSRCPNGWPPVYPRASGGTPRADALIYGAYGLSPRERGTDRAALVLDANYGLSPRERGNHPASAVDEAVQRSIPARAGEPRSGATYARSCPVYPRASGGTGDVTVSGDDGPGLSPHERGNQEGPRFAWWRTRSIPARAGEPRTRRSHRRCRPVYPRASGGTTGYVQWPASQEVYPRASGGTSDPRLPRC